MLTSPSYRVRRCGADDAVLLRQIRLEALLDTPEAYGSTYDDSRSFSLERWAEMATTRVYYLGECEGRVVGMAAGGHQDDHPGTHWLFGMYVSPSRRGSGLALQLVDAIAEWARNEGATALHLQVGSTVARARAFYEKVGFTPTHDVKIMERDPSKHVLGMVKRLV